MEEEQLSEEDTSSSELGAKASQKSEQRSRSPTQGIRRGKCKWFNVSKGWGFITPDDGGQEVFVHQSVIQMGGFRSLAENEVVEFECKYSDKGLEATRVSGPSNVECQGSSFRPSSKKPRYRKVRCYNCGEFANHIASKCSLGPMPKRCHHCKSEDHLVADCPTKPESSQKSTAGSSSPQSSRAKDETLEESFKKVHTEEE